MTFWMTLCYISESSGGLPVLREETIAFTNAIWQFDSKHEKPLQTAWVVWPTSQVQVLEWVPGGGKGGCINIWLEVEQWTNDAWFSIFEENRRSMGLRTTHTFSESFQQPQKEFNARNLKLYGGRDSSRHQGSCIKRKAWFEFLYKFGLNRSLALIYIWVTS